MTEDEAKTKVCCGPLHFSNVSSQQLCLGSQCMAWRWLVTSKTVAHIREAKKRNDRLYEDSPDIETGYCGLAGGGYL